MLFYMLWSDAKGEQELFPESSTVLLGSVGQDPPDLSRRAYSRLREHLGSKRRLVAYSARSTVELPGQNRKECRGVAYRAQSPDQFVSSTPDSLTCHILLERF